VDAACQKKYFFYDLCTPAPWKLQNIGCRNFARILFSAESTSSLTFIEIWEGQVVDCDDLVWNDSNVSRFPGDKNLQPVLVNEWDRRGRMFMYTDHLHGSICTSSSSVTFTGYTKLLARRHNLNYSMISVSHCHLL
jgi:hypothetical protein